MIPICREFAGVGMECDAGDADRLAFTPPSARFILL
jgi:hypothetical protein